MTRSRYKTLKGQVLDFDKFLAVRGSEVSVGNMGVNAKGDHINAHGDIIKTRSEIMKEKYLDPKAKYNPIRSRSNQSGSINETQPIVQQPIVQQPIVQQPIVQQPIVQQPEPAQEVQEYVKPGVIDIRHRVLGQKGFDLRGSLASAISVDLTTPDAPKPTTLTTLRRI